MSEKKMNSSRRGHLKSLMLAIAKDLLEKEAADLITEKAAFIAENCPAPVLSGGLPELQEMLKKLAQTIDKVDEDRYDSEAKVKKTDKEIEDLRMKVVEIQGIKKPALKKVRMSADAMLAALLGTKHKASMDFRANLKEVKKEVKEEEEVSDWHKNVDEQSGMDGRKKKFQSAKITKLVLVFKTTEDTE
uniref:Troponin I type 2a (skeletal, fast), tandem duplicate 1 n=1 Tax=Oncorhynchus kisutch TaxID=8019 RepID=A0A8C7IPQ8_ONCKI